MHTVGGLSQELLKQVAGPPIGRGTSSPPEPHKRPDEAAVFGKGAAAVAAEIEGTAPVWKVRDSLKL